MKKLLLIGLLGIVTLTGCQNDSVVVSRNISTDAENFKIYRRIVFYNAITGDYILEMTGYCSIEVDAEDNQLETTCKTGNDKYSKNYLGFSDNVTYTVEQLEASPASPYHYKMVFKPQSILPNTNIEVR